MEKNDHNQTDNNHPIGLMEYIRSQEEKTETLSLREELQKPYKPPQTNKFYCGIELADQLQALLNF